MGTLAWGSLMGFQREKAFGSLRKFQKSRNTSKFRFASGSQAAEQLCCICCEIVLIFHEFVFLPLIFS